ncbi:hypothetical protein [Polaromonas glacialis]|uniref:hypothetical protein n=1 Tax=Polaromonas glacialis TaxID=866564 RepID=UPI0012ECB212|nr:hypothetical protein [Polaromonas glacialis]
MIVVGAVLPQVRVAHNEGIRCFGHRAVRKIDRWLQAADSVGPKVESARVFVHATGQRAMTRSPDRIKDMLAGRAGSRVSLAGGAP